MKNVRAVGRPKRKRGRGSVEWGETDVQYWTPHEYGCKWKDVDDVDQNLWFKDNMDKRQVL